MIETNRYVDHLAGIIPIAGQPLDLNMPWHDSLMPIHNNYHAIERAVHTAATAGCNTIWIVMYRESQPIIRQKLGEWIYDPESVWQNPYPWLQVKQVPIYYVSINTLDRKRRDSLAWSCLYGAKAASRTCLKVSKWILPKRFLVISPYSIVPEKQIQQCRKLLRGKHDIAFRFEGSTFKDNNYAPFTFSDSVYKECSIHFRDKYSGNETKKTFADIFEPVNLDKYAKVDIDWMYRIDDWDSYAKFISSEHNKLCKRPKYMVTHKWFNFVKDTGEGLTEEQIAAIGTLEAPE